MTEEEIFAEIGNVFKKQMGNNDDFHFSILQHTGGGSKTLTIPSLLETFRWTASAVAGHNLKSPIYILANEELTV